MGGAKMIFRKLWRTAGRTNPGSAAESRSNRLPDRPQRPNTTEI